MCECGEGCEEYSCFIGYDCECCQKAYGRHPKCTCTDCRHAKFEDERDLRSAPEADVAASATVDARGVD